MLRFLIRWGSYPVIFGGCSAAMILLLYADLPTWPSVLLLSGAGLVAVACMERLAPYRVEWLGDHDDTWTDAFHLLVNLSVIQFTAEILALLGQLVPESFRLFPDQSPLWLQLLVVAIVLDVSLYLMHRASHKAAWLWRFHMIHHSAERLYWLNGERRHPLHAMIMAGPAVVLLIITGTPPAVLATWLGILTVHLGFQHANLDYRLGVLRWLFGVAENHRWHHKREFEDAQVNFGEFFMFWDIAFGSFYGEAGDLGDAEVGLRESAFPRQYLGQFLWPFRAKPAIQTSLERRNK